jgi:hypothetical protein
MCIDPCEDFSLFLQRNILAHPGYANFIAPFVREGKAIIEIGVIRRVKDGKALCNMRC